MKTLPIALLGLALWQPAGATMAGTWVAELKGTTFIRLELKAVDSTLAGAIGTGNLQLGKDGDVIEVSPVPTELTPLFDVVVKGFTRFASP